MTNTELVRQAFALREGLIPRAELEAFLGMSRNNMSHAISNLVKAGEIRRVSTGVYEKVCLISIRPEGGRLAIEEAWPVHIPQLAERGRYVHRVQI